MELFNKVGGEKNMVKKMNNKYMRRFFCVFIVLNIFISMFSPEITFAAVEEWSYSDKDYHEEHLKGKLPPAKKKESWTAKTDGSIYGDSATVTYDENSSSGTEKERKKPGFPIDIFVSLIIAIADGIYGLMEKVGITIDNVIYGRVGNHTKNGIALFRFELKEGNPYGVVGSVIYNIIAGIAIIFIIITIFGKFSMAMYYNGSGKKWSEFKSSISLSILSMALIAFMPYFLDISLYIADIILYTVSNDAGVALFSSDDGFDIIDSFRKSAQFGIVDAFIYLSTIFLSLYFAIIYVGYALTMVVLFVCFPIVCVGMNFDKKLISSWGKQILSILLNPIMDCILMMIPIYMGLIPGGGELAVLKIIVCAMVVPARSVLKQLLGLGSTSLELGGLAAMMGAMRLAGAAGGAISKYREKRGAAKDDKNMSKFYKEQSMNEDSTGGQGTGVGSSVLGGVMTNSRGGITPAISLSGGNSTPGISGGAASTGSASYMGTGDPMNATGSRVDRRTAEKYANVSNFESGAFKGALSSEKLSKLYKSRSRRNTASAGLSALGSLAGGVLGGGSGMFMGPGFQTHMAAMGIKAGGAAGAIADIGSHKRGPKPEAYPKPEQAAQVEQAENIPRWDGEVVTDSFGGTQSGGNYAGLEYNNAGNITQNSGSGSEPYTENYNEVPPDTQSYTQEYARCNYNLAFGLGKEISTKYTDNNGKNLWPVYKEAVDYYKDKGEPASNNDLRDKTREYATERIMREYRTKFNNSVTNTPDKRANKEGFGKFRGAVNKAVSDKDKGYLSENVFDTIDWMPRRDDTKRPL